MARDLIIPPPSPAGKPDRHGESHDRKREWGAPLEREREALPPADTLVDVGTREEPPPKLAADSPYRSRFGFLFGALIGVGIAALVVISTLVVQSGGNGQTASWSTWKPKAGGGLAAAREIADHVSKQYRLDNGDQLVGVQAGPLEIMNLPASVAVRTAPTGGDIEFVSGDAVLFTLNGLGEGGSIPGGVPSRERHMLLRREALELALYTFRYVDDVDVVVAMLPPAPPKAQTVTTAPEPVTKQAVFYRPGDLEPQLEIPLRHTIAPKTPRPDSIGAGEATRINALTLPNLFKASFTQGQDLQVYLVLDRLAE